MKKNLLVFLLMFVSIITFSFGEISGTAGVDFVSKYVWRGFLLSDGANTQPFAELSMAGFKLGYWGSFNWEEDNYNLEQDIYAGYDFSLLDGKLGVSVGYTYYKFPSLGDSKSHELWLGFSLDEVPLSPSITFYFDIGDEEKGGGDGEYVSLSLGHDFEISKEMSIGLSLSAGYNNELFIEEKGLADIHPKLSLSYAVNDNISIGLSIHYSKVIDSDVEDAMNADDEFFGVLNISVS